RYLNQYIAEVSFIGQEPGFRCAPSAYEAFSSMVESGEISDGLVDGVSLVESITGDEAEKLWLLYHSPFVELAKDHPVDAGYDKDSFMELLKDPTVIKVVNRAAGDITTLCMFMTDLN